jgi:WD40 repeat protein
VGRSHVFAGCWDKSIWSWEIDSRKAGQRFLGHSDFIKDVICVNIGRREVLISAAADAVILGWDVETGRRLWTLKGHTRGVQCLAIDPLENETGEESKDESLVLFTGGSVGEIRRWAVGRLEGAKETIDEKDGGKGFPITAHDTTIYRLVFDGDGDLWTASADKTVKSLSREKAWTVEMELAHPDFVRDVVVNGVGGNVATACRDEEIRLWDIGVSVF